VLKPKAGRIFDALVGLLLAAACTVLFVLHVAERWRIDADTVIFLFFAGGVLAGVGLFFVYRLVPRRVQSSLFGDSNGVSFQPAALAEIHAKPAECPANDAPAVTAIPAVMPSELLRNSNRRETISRYKTREGLGAMGIFIVLLFASALPARLPIGWGFLWLAIAGGGAMALVLGRRSRISNISGYAIPVAGGVVGAIVVFGLGIVMVRFHFLRDFLGMAIGGGIAVALFLRWNRARQGASKALTW
jgi:hypothetical protein